jgi:hypothetical protein
MDNLDSTFDYTGIESMHHFDMNKDKFHLLKKIIVSFTYPYSG